MEEPAADFPKTAAGLAEQARQAHAALLQVVTGFTRSELPQGAWSMKDHLAHLAAWEMSLVALFRGEPRYRVLGMDEDTYLHGGEERMNAAIQAAHSHLALEEAMAWLEEAHRQVLETLAGLSDADLQRTYSYFQPDEPVPDTGAPVLLWVQEIFCTHVYLHIEWMKALAQRTAASKAQEDL